MHNFGDWLTTGLGIVSFTTLAGFGLLRGTVVNLRERLNDKDGEIKELKTKIATVTIEKDTLKADLVALTKVVTGEVHLTILERKLNEHHTLAEAHWNRDEVLLSDILTELRK